MEYKLQCMLLQILDTWSLRLHVESNKTPRFLGGSLLGVMTESPMFMPICWFWLVLLWVVVMISSVLSSFNFKRSSISLYHWYRPKDKILLSPLILIHLVGRKYITEYRPRKWKRNSCFRIIFPRGVVYIINKIGPCTEPWGTPYYNVTGVDVHDPIWTIVFGP